MPGDAISTVSGPGSCVPSLACHEAMTEACGFVWPAIFHGLNGNDAHVWHECLCLHAHPSAPQALHAELEPGYPAESPAVAVVGISNWALDAAKVNRAVLLSR
jgi:hypothetical protein